MQPPAGNKRASTTTFALAKFLATTGPEEYPGHHNRVHPYDIYPTVELKTSNTKSNLFDRLRKKSSLANTKCMQKHPFPDQAMDNSTPVAWNTVAYGKSTMLQRKYIPLIHDSSQPKLQNGNYHQPYPQQQPFYELPDGEATLLTFPTPPASSVHESEEETDAAPNKKQVIRGSRHIQVQTEGRRASCPAMLASGAKLTHKKDLMGHEATVLLALIEQLKQQLAEEQQSRKLLEKAIQLQWPAEQN
ncbi:hypothetical protein BC941DRAFT_465531 [Chlamydoabsidia padenii]|nr:hypothetical protein BC941DRAFT_465531 [Chlamydoabsidia padenii]